MSRQQHSKSIRLRGRKAHATQRISSRRTESLRLVRTVVLGAGAVAAAIIWLGDQYGIEPAETLSYLGSAALFVVGLALLGLLGFTLSLGVKKIRQKK